jgi:hypothetical protein
MTTDVQAGLAPPSSAEVRTLLNGLFDRAVTVGQELQPVLPGRDVQVVAAYADDTGEVRAVAFCDLVLGNVLGAALALVPAPRVAEALEAGVVPQELADNTREVLNVAASMFNHGTAHLKLTDTWVVPEPVGEQAVAFLRLPAQRSDLRVEVPGYGAGVLALIVR